MNLKKICADKGMNLKELSTKTGLSLNYLYELERGVKKNPSMIVVVKIAKAFNIPIDEFINSEAV